MFTIRPEIAARMDAYALSGVQHYASQMDLDYALRSYIPGEGSAHNIAALYVVADLARSPELIDAHVTLAGAWDALRATETQQPIPPPTVPVWLMCAMPAPRKRPAILPNMPPIGMSCARCTLPKPMLSRRYCAYVAPGRSSLCLILAPAPGGCWSCLRRWPPALWVLIKARPCWLSRG